MKRPVDTGMFSDMVEFVSTELRRKIMTGEVPSGMPLRQRQLAEMLGVSRDPIKHAVRALFHEGLVLKRPRRTAIVAPIRAKLVQDVYEVRTELEAMVARNVASLSKSQRNVLKERLERTIERSRSETDASGLVELDRQFHLHIYETAGNEVALSTYNSAWTIIGRAMSLLVSTNHQEKSWAEHVELAKAISVGDAPLAASLSEEHCRSASIWLLQNARHLMIDDVDQVSETGHVDKQEEVQDEAVK